MKVQQKEQAEYLQRKYLINASGHFEYHKMYQ